ncbi:MAG: DUF4124 domain-containing protein [Gammaproteobacteria bacterium]|nr:DUF4124 domain-containing protein [Gammaproteobacteria bacterium]
MHSPRYKPPRPHPALLLTVLLVGGAAQADIYRWTDANGQVHYGSRPPADASAEAMDIPRRERPAAADSADDSAARRERQRRLLDLYRHEREQKKAAAAQAAQRRQQREQRCNRLQAQWRRLTFAAPIYFKRDDGGRDYLSDAQRAEQQARLRSAYIEACGEAPP